ncbi:MAG: ATP-binding protein [Candidatus Thermoplasmatota archaeon]|jgi:PAS domain S-box-containing protein|nr:ATP-binding protein [Candidatus Thermoplasmatota archaeon]
MVVDKEREKGIKKTFFSSINKKLTLLFVIVALIAPILGISFFYMVLTSAVPELKPEQLNLIGFNAVLIIVIIAIDAGIIGFLVSRSISKPIKELYEATKEVEKGNFNVRTNIKTNDEIQELSNAFNNTTAALAKMQKEIRDMENAKTEFLNITSHELRSPMTPMKAQLQVLENEYFGKLTREQKESLSIVIRNADRLDKIISDFLEISRIEAARLKFVFRETDLRETVKETVELMRGFANERNIKLITKTDQLPIIEVDPDRVSQVLRNLINNAIKFSDENSEVEIGAESKDDFILFYVRDYGCGLSPEDQMRVFEPFYQVEKKDYRKYGGTGLGLTICRGIVESQKGKIWVESKPGEGCTFYFTVPHKPVRETEPIKTLFSSKNITEKNREIICVSENKWVENEFDSVFLSDENANILDCNENLYKRLGYTRDEMLSLNMADFDALESKKDIMNRINEAKKNGSIDFKTIHKTKDGSAVLVHETMQYIKDKNVFRCIVREE